MAQLRGRVVLVDFWTYSCVNCLRTLPYLKDWYRKYASRGLTIVGVHSPEFAFEADPANVSRAGTPARDAPFDQQITRELYFGNEYRMQAAEGGNPDFLGSGPARTAGHLGVFARPKELSEQQAYLVGPWELQGQWVRYAPPLVCPPGVFCYSERKTAGKEGRF